MKKSYKILLGIVTIWPFIYMLIFMIGIFSFIIFMPFEENRSSRVTEYIDLIQLEQKIQKNELKSLTITGSEIVAEDRTGEKRYRVDVKNETTKAEIIRQAQERDETGQPRVEKIEETPAKPVPVFLPIGMMGFFAVHLLTIFLILGLTALYIYLAIKSDRLDQTMKIVWTVLFCMMSFLAMPVFWYLYVWREPAKPATQSVETPIQ